MNAVHVWDLCKLASADHPYVAKKGGTPAGLRIYVEANGANNPTRTPLIPVNGVLESVLRCLLDWLEQKNNGKKNHQILTALASESLKKINAPEASRRFDKRDIWSACDMAHGEKDLGSWLKWPDIEKYWKVRQDDFLDFADSRGVDYYPILERKTTPGRTETLYWISVKPVAELKQSKAEEANELDATPEKEGQSNKNPGLELEYQCTQPGDIACAFLLKPWLNKGKIVLKGWRVWSVVLPLLMIGITMFALLWLAFAMVNWGGATTKQLRRR